MQKQPQTEGSGDRRGRHFVESLLVGMLILIGLFVYLQFHPTREELPSDEPSIVDDTDAGEWIAAPREEASAVTNVLQSETETKPAATDDTSPAPPPGEETPSPGAGTGTEPDRGEDSVFENDDTIGGRSSKDFRIVGVETSQLRTPVFDASGARREERGGRIWREVAVTYESRMPWLDTLELHYIVAFASRTTEVAMVTHRTVTYGGIGPGRHESRIYLHPQTLKRYGDMTRIMVIARSGTNSLARAIRKLTDHDNEKTHLRNTRCMPYTQNETPFFFLDTEEAASP